MKPTHCPYSFNHTKFTDWHIQYGCVDFVFGEWRYWRRDPPYSKFQVEELHCISESLRRYCSEITQRLLAAPEERKRAIRKELEVVTSYRERVIKLEHSWTMANLISQKDGSGVEENCS